MMPRTIELQDDEIAIVWSAEDVKQECAWLTDDQSCDVLNAIEHRHDACIGINWEVIHYTAEWMYPNDVDLALEVEETWIRETCND
tara:strand:- start:37 stop:294 length:258 start_codon:yes stop_codon:yes gene_type:complete